MEGPYDERRCRVCPKRCSYAVHVHKHVKRERVLDVAKMEEQRAELNKKLKNCLRDDSLDFRFGNLIRKLSII